MKSMSGSRVRRFAAGIEFRGGRILTAEVFCLEGRREGSVGFWLLLALLTAAVVWLMWSAAKNMKRSPADRDAVLVYKEAVQWREDI